MRALRLLGLWLQVAGGTVAFIAILWLSAQYVFHLRLLNVQTGSMRPSFKPGDALIMRQGGQPVLGEIVAYHSPRNANELVTHRVVKLSSGSMQTKGDALTTPDPPVRTSLLAGRVVAILPGMGTFLGWLQTWPGLVVCIYLPAAAIAIQELIRLERAFKPKLYRLREVV